MLRAGRHLTAFILAGLLATVAGCDEATVPIHLEPKGAAWVVVPVPRSVPAGAVARVTVTASGEGIPSESRDLAGSGTLWQGQLGYIRAGDGRTLRVEGFDASGQPLFQAEESGIHIAPDRTPLVVLTAREEVATSSENAAPFIDSVVAPSEETLLGGTLALRTRVHDGDAGDVLTFAWKATGGTFDASASASAMWTAPDSEGTQTLTLTVSDSRGASASLDFTVHVRGEGVDASSSEVSASYNRWPRLDSLATEPSALVAIGEGLSVEASGVDGDTDTLSYAWTSSCEGTWTDGTSARATFSPTVLPEGACNNCRLSVAISDGHGGHTEGAVDVCIRPPKLPPIILSTTNSGPGAGPGDVLRLGITARDPNDEPLTITWKANAGVLSTPVRTGNASSVAWVALSCVTPFGLTRVSATVTNASGLSVTRDFAVDWSGPVCTRPSCGLDFQDANQRLALKSDCASDLPLVVPDGFTFDGAGRVLTAVDAADGHFAGAVLRNRGATMHVRNLTVTTDSLADVCDSGADALRGVLFEGASGSVTDSEVRGLRQGGDAGGCQEGHGIEVRNLGPGEDVQKVDVLRNHVAGYQKTGILAVGRVDVTVADNVLDGGGPTGAIARNGIQLDSGATGRVTGNHVDGNAYTGADYFASGILVVGGSYNARPLCTDAVIEGNQLDGNDVGIFLFQAEGPDASPPAASTRIRVTDNDVNRDVVTNGYVYQAGISDLGGGNTIFGNRIAGAGYALSNPPGSTFPVNVVGGDVAKVAFLSAPQTVDAGACSGRVIVQSQDVAGNLKGPGAALFTLEATGAAAAGITFHADPGCTGEALTTVSLDNPQAETDFYFKASQPGALTVGVSGAGLSGSQDATVR